MSAPVIAIDGPAGVGKSTLARRLARRLDLPYVNTGLMYRELASRALRAGVAPKDADALAELASAISFQLDHTARPPELLIDGRPPDAELSSPEVESSVSQVSAHPSVREIFRAEQRRLAADGAVMEGRDIGSVVAPDASLKLYLLAHPTERAGRRADEREEEAEAVAESLEVRDTRDARTNPFVPASDASRLDTTELSADEVFELALELARARGLLP